MTKTDEKSNLTSGGKVWVVLHPTSKDDKKKTSKFMPKINRSYLVVI